MPPNLFSFPDDLSFLSSEPFEIISQSGKSYFVHSSMLTAQSEPFRCTTMGVWKEATEKKIYLSDWDDDTVERFIHFLYSGDYRFPKLTPGATEAEVTTGINALLVHAKMYVLAQYKDVAALRTMALGRLKTMLGEIDSHMFPRMAMNVIELLEYVYSNTDSLLDSEEPIRTLVSTFAAENFEKLMIQDGEMALLVGGGGDFVIDLMGRVARRLCDAEKRGCDLEEETRRWKYQAAVSQAEMRKLEKPTEDKVMELMTAKMKLEWEVERLKGYIKWFEAASPRFMQRWI